MDKNKGLNSESVLFPLITHVKKRLFLTTYSEQGAVGISAELSGISRFTHYKWLQNDPDYAEAFHEAERSAITSLEDEARKRAIGGSDTLLIFLLKGLRPERYSDRQRVTHEFTNESDEALLDKLRKSDNLRAIIAQGVGAPGTAERN